ncbi:hypothetical protein CVS40_3498 [Lucilia cuprina]|nr:hypothetical protein CVS40_3498 [Lucilia cuprina]
MSLNWFLLLFILPLLHHSKGWILNFESFSQEYNPDLVEFINFRLINYTNKIKALNGSIMYKKDLNQFDVTFILTAPKLNGQPWTVLNVTVNGCEYLVKSRGNNIKKFPYFFLSELRVSNPDFPKNCPIEKGKEIPVRNFYIRSEKISMNFPQVPFSCICILRRHRVQAFKLFFNGSVKTKN